MQAHREPNITEGESITGDEGLDRLLQNGIIQDTRVCCGGRGPHQEHGSFSITMENGTIIKSLSLPVEKSISIQINGETYKKKEALSFTNQNFSFLSAMNNNGMQNTLPKTYQYMKFSANQNTGNIITREEFDTVFNQLPEEVKNVLAERINSNFAQIVGVMIIPRETRNDNNHYDNNNRCTIL